MGESKLGDYFLRSRVEGMGELFILEYRIPAGTTDATTGTTGGLKSKWEKTGEDARKGLTGTTGLEPVPPASAGTTGGRPVPPAVKIPA